MRLSKILSLLLVSVLVLCGFSGCKKNSVKAFYFTVPTSAGTFDPQIARDSTARMIVRNCYEGLVQLDENLSPVPGVANSWSISEDGLTYTFTLSQNAVWYVNSSVKAQFKDKLTEDFAPKVTAHDFAFGLLRALSPDTLAPDASLLFCIQNAEDYYHGEATREQVGIQALNDQTLVITLNAPTANLFEILTEPIAMPCNEEFFNLCGGRYGLFVKTSLFNGPFTLTRFDETSYRLAKNTVYTGSLSAKADVIWFYAGKTLQELKDGMASGDYDGGYIGFTDRAGFEADEAEFLTVTDITRGFLFNLNANATGNLSIRKAFCLATDITELCNKLNTDSASSILPPSFGLTPIGKKQEAKGELAQAELQKGLEETELETVSLTVLCEPQYEAVLKEYMQLWQKYLGFSCSLMVSAESANQLKSDVAAGNFDIAFYPLKSGFVTPYGFYRCFYSASGDNFAQYANEETDRMILSLPQYQSGQLLTAAGTLENAINEQYVFLPVCYENSVFVTTRKTTGIIMQSGNDRIYFYGCDSK